MHYYTVNICLLVCFPYQSVNVSFISVFPQPVSTEYISGDIIVLSSHVWLCDTKNCSTPSFSLCPEFKPKFSYLLPNRRALEETRSQVSKVTQKRKLETFGLCHLSHFKRSKAVPTFWISTLSNQICEERYVQKDICYRFYCRFMTQKCKENLK